MRAKFKNEDEDEMTEILRRAVRASESSGAGLQQGLAKAAAELGISDEALRAAEASYRRDKERSRMLAEYREESTKVFRLHLLIYCIVNVALVGFNLMTFSEDHEIWFPYALLGWGIGLAINAVVAYRRVDWKDEEFQKWLAKRKDAGEDATP